MPDETVYLASSFSLKDRVQRVRDALVDAGFEIADVWWDESKEQADLKVIDVPDTQWYWTSDVQQRALRHYENIQRADVFVLVCPTSGTKKYNGANVELGYAFAHGLDCYAVGRLERSAMYVGPNGVPVAQCETIGKLLSELIRR